MKHSLVPNTTAPTLPVRKRMTRTGKIARLSSDLHEQINSRLSKGEQAGPLLKWLNSLPEVQDLLRSEFNSRPISPQNLSEWRNGGYRDWQIRQDALQLAHNLDDEHSFGHKSLTGSFSEKLARWLILRFAAAAQNLAASETSPDTEWLRLRELCSDVARLRRGDLYAEHLRIRRDWLALQQSNATHRREDLFWQWTKRPDIANKLFPDRKGGMSEESIRWMEKECLGMDDEHGIFQHVGNTLRNKRLAREAEAAATAQVSADGSEPVVSDPAAMQAGGTADQAAGPSADSTLANPDSPHSDLKERDSSPPALPLDERAGERRPAQPSAHGAPVLSEDLECDRDWESSVEDQSDPSASNQSFDQPESNRQSGPIKPDQT